VRQGGWTPCMFFLMFLMWTNPHIIPPLPFFIFLMPKQRLKKTGPSCQLRRSFPIYSTSKWCWNFWICRVVFYELGLKVMIFMYVMGKENPIS